MNERATQAERIARGQRASAAWDEFFAPMIDELKAAYAERMVEIANTELSRDKRSDKITALANATRILTTIEAGMKAIATDGEIAARERVQAEKIETMTKPQRRLLNIGGY